jgi:hypothetical protein
MDGKRGFQISPVEKRISLQNSESLVNEIKEMI